MVARNPRAMKYLSSCDGTYYTGEEVYHEYATSWSFLKSIQSMQGDGCISAILYPFVKEQIAL